MTKQAQKIEVGIHDGRPGFTIEYTDGERAHFVFHRTIARRVADGLARIVADLDYLDKQLGGAPSDRIGIQDVSHVRIMPPQGGALGASGEDGVRVTD